MGELVSEQSSYNLVSSETLQAKPRTDIAGFFILADQYTMMETFRQYEYHKSIGTGEAPRKKCRLLADIKTLYFKIKNDYQDRNKSKTDIIEELIAEKNPDDEQVTAAILELLRYLEKDLGLTKIATRANYDRTNIVQSNKHHGY